MADAVLVLCRLLTVAKLPCLLSVPHLLMGSIQQEVNFVWTFFENIIFRNFYFVASGQNIFFPPSFFKAAPLPFQITE